MKKILVPCDFSRPAVSAYRFALDIGRQSGGAVHLLNVVELPTIYDIGLAPVLAFEADLMKGIRAKAEEQFKILIAKYKADDVTVDFSVRFGPVSATIQDYIKSSGIDLVVMGSHGASGAREVFIGSNAERTVRYSPVPVLVLKDYYKGPIKNIVFPNTLDTERQEQLVSKVKALQDFFKAHLYVVWINTPASFTPDPISQERLSDFAKRYMLKDYTLSLFSHWDEEEGILEFTKMVKGDLIAMGTHGRTGLAHLFNGSVAEDVVNHTKGIVWTYPLKREPVEA